jgi:hypothetical protein
MISWVRQGVDPAAIRVLRRFIAADEPARGGKKKMVVMIGPPAAGKGFFLGEPEKDKGSGGPKKYKTEKGEERDTTFGYKLPESTQGLFKDEDIPASPDADESDNHLRAIQFEESKKHYDQLARAHKHGPDAFKEALSDIWYDTKDGEKVSLAKQLKYQDFAVNDEDPIAGHGAFLKQHNKDFYVSMRGWHDDASEKNPETGKPKERFKDQARHRFDDNIMRTTESEKSSGMMIVDSAGEDIDAQDFKGQIEHAKAAGFEVSVIFLHPEQADTELSNLSRGKVMGKRMVDQSDITNWYKKNEDALKAIQEADPDNFLHYRKGPPAELPKEAEARRKQARDLMNKLSSLEGEEKEKAKGEINKILYGAASYKLMKSTSYGRTLKGLPEKPEEDIAASVKRMNEDAEKRVGEGGAPKKEEGGEEKRDKGEEKEKTKGNFLKDVGDKEVSNPHFNAQKAESHSNPRKRKIRNLPSEDMQKYYQQWAKASSVTPRVVMAARVVLRWKEREMLRQAADEEKGWLQTWMTKLASDIEAKVKVEDYKLSAEAGKGPLVYVTLKDAEGDTTTFRKAKAEIEKIAEESIKREVRNDKFACNVNMSSKGDDMVISVEIIFPK